MGRISNTIIKFARHTHTHTHTHTQCNFICHTALGFAAKCGPVYMPPILPTNSSVKVPARTLGLAGS